MRGEGWRNRRGTGRARVQSMLQEVPAVPDVRPRFVIEPPLIKLGRWMRAAGDDVTSAEAGLCTIDQSQRAARENRVVLTRRRDFPPGPARVLLILADRLEDQLAQVYAAFGAPDAQAAALTRCVLCNTTLEQVDRRTVALPPRVEIREPRVLRCPSCARLYWEGTHTEAMRSRLRLILDRLPKAGPSIPASSEAASPTVAAPELGPGTTEENRRIAELRCFLESFGFAWRGYRKKRRKARANLARRMVELGMPNLAAYATRIQADSEERRRLHEVVGITVRASSAIASTGTCWRSRCSGRGLRRVASAARGASAVHRARSRSRSRMLWPAVATGATLEILRLRSNPICSNVRGAGSTRARRSTRCRRISRNAGRATQVPGSRSIRRCAPASSSGSTTTCSTRGPSGSI